LLREKNALTATVNDLRAKLAVRLQNNMSILPDANASPIIAHQTLINAQGKLASVITALRAHAAGGEA